MSNSKDTPPPTVQRRQPHVTRCVAIVVLVLILLTLFVIAVIWLAVQPKKLIFSIEHSSITGNNATAGNSTFHCLLRSRNPNKRVSFQFKRIEVEATYRGTKLFNGSVAPFRQPVRNVTEVEVDLPEVRAALQAKEADQFKAERAAGVAKMEVKATGKMNMKIGVFKVHRTVTAACGPYDVPFKESEGFRWVDCHTDISY
ncbi:hypothetical protein SASPL_119486 [Salvia splendens]|uniref:Late embryogenesis abundant protein LEA-2 subgroup domain-containing protein n=1 Tax=Salvia splendens TaxID=180675 RepID=A0A8X8ZT65_SALSN|nr:uncharacterized protein At1g08160-like [Salvia splendens]KAG6417332.1 hypothetical protein SASPL_119486 [Salvia splendens]